MFDMEITGYMTAEGASFEYERELSSWDASFRYPDFTLFINDKLHLALENTMNIAKPFTK